MLLSSLMPVLTDESLQNCLEQESNSSLVIHALQLFKALTKSNEVVSSLCSNSTGENVAFFYLSFNDI